IHHFKYLATTLSISPYKDSNCLNAIGESLAESGETKWLYSDFKKRGGYNKSIEMCNTYGIYRQHYCGCEYSIFQEKAEE
ncbi:MAG: epoxyqueuosine reductase QueH, partial [Clostridia bacterium]